MPLLSPPLSPGRRYDVFPSSRLWSSCITLWTAGLSVRSHQDPQSRLCELLSVGTAGIGHLRESVSKLTDLGTHAECGARATVTVLFGA